MSGLTQGRNPLPCKICSTPAGYIASKKGAFKKELFDLYRCPRCAFAFVGNPWLNYAEVYSEAYYKGDGADPTVDYFFELESPGETVRQYEWEGIVKAVRSCLPLRSESTWLDFGSGNGGLVRHALRKTACSIWGFEDGWIREAAGAKGVPMLSRAELEAKSGTFDVITAIEVLEHVDDPIATLTYIRSLLRPGGLFFYTTGNAAPFHDRLEQWRYVVPEVHISFYEPQTLAEAFSRTGFRSDFRGFLPGYEGIVQFKILKALGRRKVTPWQKLAPWGLLTRMADQRYHVTAHPLGWAERSSE